MCIQNTLLMYGIMKEFSLAVEDGRSIGMVDVTIMLENLYLFNYIHLLARRISSSNTLKLL